MSSAAIQQARAEAAEAQCARLKKALEFYADEDTWRVPETGWTPAGQDKGLIARTAIRDLPIDAETGGE